MSGPLAGLRILDVTSVIMGPYSTSILADLGADVIKLESPEGDISRRLGPSRNLGMSAITLNMQRNKRSEEIDLGSIEGRERLAELVANADALVTNLRPSSRARLGLDWSTLRPINPRLVLCTAQAYASSSAQRDEPAYDDIIQAVSGMADIYGRVWGEPRYSPSIIADKVCGLTIVNNLLAGLHHARATGEGQWVDVPMADVMVAFNLVEHLEGRAFEPSIGEIGWGRTLAPERRPLRAMDGWISLMPYTDKNWSDFFLEVGEADLATDARFNSPGARHMSSGPLQLELGRIVAARSVAEWRALSRAIGIAFAEVLDLDHVDDNPYFAARRILREAEHPSEGRYRVIRYPVDFSATPVEESLPAPALGQNTGEGWATLPAERTTNA